MIVESLVKNCCCGQISLKTIFLKTGFGVTLDRKKEKLKILNIHKLP